MDELAVVKELLIHKEIELSDLETSLEYRQLLCKTDNVVTINRLLVGSEVVISGDLEEIKVNGKNKVSLRVLYRTNHKYSNNKYVVVRVKNEADRKFIMNNIDTDKGIRLIVRFNGESITEFDLVKIIDYNINLTFGHYVCSGDNKSNDISDVCHRDWGNGIDVPDFNKHYCEICGSSLRYVENIYEI